MKIRVITYQKLTEILGNSLKVGAKNYIAFLLTIAIFSVPLLLTKISLAFGIVGSIARPAYLAGCYFVSQSLIPAGRKVSVLDSFIAFKNSKILKRIVRAVIIETLMALAIVTVLLIAIAIILIAVVFLGRALAPQYDVKEFLSSLKVMNVSIALLLFAEILRLPFRHFMFLYLMQDKSWKKIIMPSLMGVLKNIHWHLLYVFSIVISVWVFLSAGISYGLFEAEKITDVVRDLYIWANLLVAPFLVNFIYQYNKIVYAFEDPEIVLGEQTKYLS
jgi:hypothetical protein